MSNIIYIDDEKYPKLLKQIGKEAPKQLYFKTNTLKTNIFENCLTVVGSRKLTSYGKQTMEELVGKIALTGITIVSGFMYGGDAVAHQAAIKAGGRTIAVMPCGIDRISPEYQKELYQEILDNNGLIMSEYKGNMAPTLWTYPQRNRIAAGLSKALLVVEAGEKSGCLITANYAKKFKRKVFAVPGPITSSVAKGSNALIKEGAEMVLNAKDVLDYYGSDLALRKTNFFESHSSISSSKDKFLNRFPLHRAQTPRFKNLPSKLRALNKNPKNTEEQIIDLLKREPLGADELSRKLGISVSELGVNLSILEMQEIIKLRGNKYGVN